MIVTRRKQIPLHWILLAAIPWATGSFIAYTMGPVILFSLRKFVDNPAGLTFILTLPTYVSIFLAPICSFLSDRIWTCVGRRKPFVLISWIGMGASLLLMPFMPNLWSLICLYILFSMSGDIGSPLEPLKQEIVPPHQRGGATGAMQWIQNVAGLVFYFVALGRFDDVRFMGGRLMSGESLIYWSTGLLLFVTFFLLALGIREINPKSHLVGQPLTFGIFFRALLDRDLWPVYTLAFGAAMMGSSLGPLSNLLYTEQWGYSKQDMGTNVAVGGVLNIFIIGFLALIADRLNRLQAYQMLITLFLVVQIIYFVYVEFILPDQRPSLVEIILFGETLSVIGTLTGMVYLPLVYDYITRDKMGTYGAGSAILRKLTGIITLNAVGLFVWGYASLCGPPPGEIVRICFKNETSAAQVQSMVTNHTWRYPTTDASAPSSAVHAKAWYSTGIVLKTGTCWDVRLRDQRGEDLAQQIQELNDKLSALNERKKELDDKITVVEASHNPTAIANARQTDESCTQSIHALESKLDPLETAQKDRADNFATQVTKAWHENLLTEGDQIVAARVQDALVVEIATKRRVSAALEKSLLDLRRKGINIIDVRRIQQNVNYGVAVSAFGLGSVDEQARISELVNTTTSILGKRERDLFASPPQLLGHWRQPAVVLEVRVVEDPLDDHVSPVTGIVNGLLSLIDDAPQPEHRMAATARSLRKNGETEHVAIESVPGHGRMISVVMIPLPQAPRSSIHDALTHRLQNLLGPVATPEIVAQTRAFYDRLVDAAAVQKITIEQPVLTAAYAGLKYDYMTGYIAIFLLALIGLAITFAFARREKLGLIRKLGVEEAEGIRAASSALGHLSPDTVAATDFSETKIFYTPGCAGWKAVVILIGMLIFIYGWRELWTPLDLLINGTRATAQVVRVIRTKAGLPNQVFTDDVQLNAACEQNDRSYVFWDEFQFTTTDGMSHTFRLPIGNRLGPLFPLLDDDGLPSTATICYQTDNPEMTCMPSVISTWFAPGIITFMGLLCTVIGIMLFCTARKRIEIP